MAVTTDHQHVLAEAIAKLPVTLRDDIVKLVAAAAALKYLIDIQPVGKMFHPVRIKDVRDSQAYREASRVLALFEGSFNHLDFG